MNINGALLAARLKAPYATHIITALTPIAEPAAGTMAVDSSWRLYYNPDLEMTDFDAGAVIALHEIEHLRRRHCDRLKHHAPFVANLAGDLAINGADVVPQLPGCVHAALLNLPYNLPAEEYAERLVDTAPDSCTTCGGGSGAGNPKEFEQPSAPGLSKAEQEIALQQTADLVRQMHKSKPGSVPADWVVWADAEADRVRVPWPRQLMTRIGAVVGGPQRTSTWRRPRERDGVLACGKCRRQTEVAVIIDTSGSMGGSGPAVLGVVLNALRQFDVTAIEVDTQPRVVPSHRLLALQFRGGGGTDLRPAFEMAGRRPVIVITDCETPWPAEPPPQHLVVCIGGGEVPAGWTAWHYTPARGETV